MTLLQIILTTLGVSVLSVIGILFFYVKQKRFNKIMLSLVALSAGAMLGNTAFHLLPESFEFVEAGAMDMMTMMLLFVGAFVFSFLFETLFSWHHCHTASHHGEKDSPKACKSDIKSYSHLILYSDGIHNFIDGMIIAAAFIVNPALGVTTAVAVALHEVPQELGDFAVLVHGGFRKKKALILNFLAASTVVLGGVVGYFLTQSVEMAVPVLLPFAAGSFMYIAAADLLPELKHDENQKSSLTHFAVFLVGLIIMALSAFLGAH